jgi:hypothetical protein
MKRIITVYSLASDDDYGTKAEVFADEQEAVDLLVRRLKYIDEAPEGTIEKLVASYFAPGGEDDFYEDIQEWKGPYDTYSVASHALEVEL